MTFPPWEGGTLGRDAGNTWRVQMAAIRIVVAEGDINPGVLEEALRAAGIGPLDEADMDDTVEPVLSDDESLTGPALVAQSETLGEGAPEPPREFVAGPVFREDGPLERLFRNSIIGHIARRTGRTRVEVSDALAQVEADSGRPLLDWLRNGGLEALFNLVKLILGLL